jgi:aspartate racemase
LEKKKKYPDIIIFSVDLTRYLGLLNSQEYGALAKEFDRVLQALRNAGAEKLIITSLSMHKIIPLLKNPKGLLNMAGLLCSSIREKDILVLGTTNIVQNQEFMSSFKQKVHTVSREEQDVIEGIIKKELNFGIMKGTSKKEVVDIIKSHVKKNFAVVLACTALPGLITAKDIGVPVYNPVDIACRKVIEDNY